MAAPKLPDLEELLRLDPAVRLEVIRVLWNSLVDGGYEPPLTEYERQIIDERLEEHRRNPGAGIPWETVKAQLKR